MTAGEFRPVFGHQPGPGSDVRNVSDAILFILRNVTPRVYGDEKIPTRFNITSGDRVDNLTMAQLIAHALDRPLKYELVDWHTSRPGHDAHYGLDSSRLHSLGWSAPVSLEEGVQRLVKWEMSR